MRNTKAVYHSAKQRYKIYKNIVNQDYQQALLSSGEFFAGRQRKKLANCFQLEQMRLDMIEKYLAYRNTRHSPEKTLKV